MAKAPVTEKVRRLVLESMEAHRDYVKKHSHPVMRKTGENSKGESTFTMDKEASEIKMALELQSIEDRINLYRTSGTFKGLT